MSSFIHDIQKLSTCFYPSFFKIKKTHYQNYIFPGTWKFSRNWTSTIDFEFHEKKDCILEVYKTIALEIKRVGSAGVAFVKGANVGEGINILKKKN